jgi:hypothetical protein
MSLTIKVQEAKARTTKGTILPAEWRVRRHAQKLSVAAVSQCSVSHRTPIEAPNRRSIVSIDTCRTFYAIATKRVNFDIFVFKVNDVLITCLQPADRWDGVDDIATRRGWSRDRIPVGSESFRTRSDRSLGPPNLLENG